MVQLTEKIIKAKTRVDRLEDLKTLNLWGQDLDDVQILGALTSVEVLSLSVNRIRSLRDFAGCSRLHELYLRKNDIAVCRRPSFDKDSSISTIVCPNSVNDLEELCYLQPLSNLRVLWLSENPCAERPDYRATVIRALPNLSKLDNDDVTPMERDAALRGGTPPDQPPSSPTRWEQPVHSPSHGGMGSPTARGQGPMSPSATGGQYGGAATGGGQYGGSQPPMSAGRRNKNILYAVMALVPELDDDDLVLVKRDIEARLAGAGHG